MKNWCVNPFYNESVVSGKNNSPCCVVIDEHDGKFNRQVLQQDFDKDIKSKYCKACWENEKHGILSKRQQDNRWLSWYSSKNLEQLYEQRNDNKILSIQYKTSNLCNLACKTCLSFDSTRWYSEDNFYKKTNRRGVMEGDHTQILDQTLKQLVKLEILGGESFLDRNHVSLLQRLIDLDNTNLQLIYTTNCQQLPNTELLSCLEKFSKIQVNLSIDGIDKVFEYVRYPGTWDKALKTYEQLKTFPWHLTVYTTLSNMNVYYYDELLEWILQNFSVADFNYQILQAPKEMAVHVMPQKLKDKINNKFTKHKFKTFLNPIMTAVNKHLDNPELLNKFKETIGKQDTFRKQDPKNFVPEIVEYLL